MRGDVGLSTSRARQASYWNLPLSPRRSPVRQSRPSSTTLAHPLEWVELSSLWNACLFSPRQPWPPLRGAPGERRDVLTSMAVKGSSIAQSEAPVGTQLDMYPCILAPMLQCLPTALSPSSFVSLQHTHSWLQACGPGDTETAARDSTVSSRPIGQGRMKHLCLPRVQTLTTPQPVPRYTCFQLSMRLLCTLNIEGPRPAARPAHALGTPRGTVTPPWPPVDMCICARVSMSTCLVRGKVLLFCLICLILG
jgi:hypothetical protein